MDFEKICDEDIIIGIEKSLSNAKELIEEGDILLTENKFSRPYCLYQLAAEEVGKSTLLFSLLFKRKLGAKINYKEIKKEFTDHPTKTKNSVSLEKIAILVVASGEKDKPLEEKVKDFLESLERIENDNNIKELNNQKNNALYVGVKNNKFVKPKEIINKQMAEGIRINALNRLEVGETIIMSFLSNIEKIIKLAKEIEYPEGYNVEEKIFELFLKN